MLLDKSTDADFSDETGWKVGEIADLAVVASRICGTSAPRLEHLENFV